MAVRTMRFFGPQKSLRVLMVAHNIFTNANLIG